ncbi:hypothetical protein thsps21_34650 [Pseudomonas sp. No.21]|uniref:hypothetical protein n=1 Tax=Pseudomonas tohonis TaxID=2725477 RepID=UPI001F43B203|nr:hypothetical protein [Pseudomonas tohonis]GJN45854.1 hypothetical protein TUM20249_18400 [Pseudomonas tohonis]
MSEGYYLVCMDCRVGVVLGKSIAIKYMDFPEHKFFGFSELGGGGVWQPSIGGCADLQQFLVVHRVHELRVLPESVDMYADNVGVPHSSPDGNCGDSEYSRTKFFTGSVEKPNPELDKVRITEELIEKLRRF